MKQRRKSFVDSEVQGALARRLVVHWVIYIATATALSIGLLVLSDPFTPAWRHVIEAVERYGPFVMVLFCLAPIFTYDAIKLSNRFAGPMTRLRKAVRALASGEPVEPIRLRPTDFWQDAASDFNRVLDRVNGEKPDFPPAPKAAD